MPKLGKLGLLLGFAAMLAGGLANTALADNPRHGRHGWHHGGHHGGGHHWGGHRWGGYHGGYYPGRYHHYYGGGGWAPVALVGGLAAGYLIADSRRPYYGPPRYGYVSAPPVAYSARPCNVVNRMEEVEGYSVRMAATMCYDENGVPYIVQGSEYPVDEVRTAYRGEDLGEALEQDCHVALTGVWFDFNRSTLKPESDRALRQVLDLLQGDPALTLEVQGHTDGIGTDSYNEALSQDRADAVVAWLVRRGIDDRRLVARGYGETMPVADNRSDAGRAQNRRVEIVNPECGRREAFVNTPR